ncbi:MAG: phosphoglucomutase, alpha-D-glucose phosphate-specific [Pseudomonadota bacterium]
MPLDPDALERAYRAPAGPLAPVKNGTSGHRGLTGAGFCDAHVAAMTQALVDIRQARGTFGPAASDDPAVNLRGGPPGPVVIGKDVRFTSDWALVTAVEVFAGNGVPVILAQGGRATPTPVVSHAIRAAQARRENVEGVIITASHNPPDEAGYKSNGVDGGPNTRTGPVDARANALLANPSGIRRVPYQQAVQDGLVQEQDLLTPYLSELDTVVDMDLLRGQRFAATPLGGSAHGVYGQVNELFGTDIQIFLDDPDPAACHRTPDWDGKLRGDPSSPYVMRAVQGLRARAGAPLIGANDNDADRFGAEDATGILNPNHVLCVLFDYLCQHRALPDGMGLGRTIGTTHMLDRIAAEHGRPVHEVDVGFKWYVEGLKQGRYVLAGEESAGLSLPRRDGSPWVTEKDGIAAVLLMMESVVRTGLDLGSQYRLLEQRHGAHAYERVDTLAEPTRKARLGALAQHGDEVRRLLQGQLVAGRAVVGVRVGDGVRVELDGGLWVLKRPSGTEDIIKDYREVRDGDIAVARQASLEIGALLGLGA